MTVSTGLRELPITSIKPEGWLRAFLEKQRDGLTGHMEVAGNPFDTPGWGARRVRGNSVDWWPYEQVGYWVDGAIRCGYLLGDDALVAKAGRQIDYVLKHAGRDGYLGPDFLKPEQPFGRWPHAVFFRAMMALHSATGDKRIARAIARHYLSGAVDHSDGRNVCNVEIMLWAYKVTGDRRLLDCAVETYKKYNRVSAGADTSVRGMLSPKRGNEHGVTYNEICKLGALFYPYTGNRRWLRATENAYRKIDRYHMMIDGVCSSSEYLRGKDPLDCHETCDIADYTWSVGYLLMATRQAVYADKIERAVFNALPGATTEDFRALQYLSGPNQVVADRSSNHNLYARGWPWMSYRPMPGTECCPGEVNRVMPNYCARTWMSDGADGLIAALYGPSRVTARVGKARLPVTIVEETNYPFSERIDFQVRAERPVAFPLTLRVPGWCPRAKVLVNGAEMKKGVKAGSFLTVRRKFAHNDRVTLLLPMKLKTTRWPRGGIGIERGPIVFALPIKEKRSVDTLEKNQTKDFPAWNMYPESVWNYALALDKVRLDDAVEVVHQPWSPEPWSAGKAPVTLRVPARRVSGWRMLRLKKTTRQTSTWDSFTVKTVTGDFRFTPQLPDPKTLHKRLGKKVETLTLVPYGCTNLRIAIFPRCKGK